MATTAVHSAEDLAIMIRDVVAEVAEVQPDQIQPDTHFVEDLEMDSMMALEILSIIEKKLDVQIDEEYMRQMTSINNVLRILEEIL